MNSRLPGQLNFHFDYNGKNQDCVLFLSDGHKYLLILEKVLLLTGDNITVPGDG